MKGRMELREATQAGSVAQGGNGHAAGALPASEQFYTRSCARCAGLLVNDWCYDVYDTGRYAEILRCVQCGNRVDPLILQNHIRSSVTNNHVTQVQPWLPTSMGWPPEAA